jgi:hypothetical protein
MLREVQVQRRRRGDPSVNARQAPVHALSVFRTYIARPSALAPVDETAAGTLGPVGSSVVQSTGVVTGDVGPNRPDARLVTKGYRQIRRGIRSGHCA